MAGDNPELEQLKRACNKAERRSIIGDLLAKHRERLRLMVHLRLDPRLQGRIDTSDVLQETCLEAYERLDEYLKKPEVSMFVWLRFLAGQRIQTFHRCHLGAQVRDVRREVSLFHGAMPQATSAALAARLVGREITPSEHLLRAERKVLLQEALNNMDPMDREIIALRHFERLSNAEAGEILGIRELTAKKRYFRALKRLKTNLANLIPPERGGVS